MTGTPPHGLWYSGKICMYNTGWEPPLCRFVEVCETVNSPRQAGPGFRSETRESEEVNACMRRPLDARAQDRVL